jgi:hypothetical protein
VWKRTTASSLRQRLIEDVGLQWRVMAARALIPGGQP